MIVLVWSIVVGRPLEERSNRYNRHESDGMGFQSANKVNLEGKKS